jgi:hypothetical protein
MFMHRGNFKDAAYTSSVFSTYHKSRRTLRHRRHNVISIIPCRSQRVICSRRQRNMCLVRQSARPRRKATNEYTHLTIIYFGSSLYKINIPESNTSSRSAGIAQSSSYCHRTSHANIYSFKVSTYILPIQSRERIEIPVIG